MRSKGRSNDGVDILTVILCLLFCTLRLSSYVPYETGKLLSHGSFAFWIISLIIFSPHKFHKIIASKRYLLLLAFIFYGFLTSLNAGVTAIFGLLGASEIAAPFLMYDIYKDSSRRVRSIIIVVITGVIVTNLYYLYQILQVSSLGLRANIDEDYYVENSFAMVYGLTMLSVALVSVLTGYVKYFKTKKNFIRITLVTAGVLLCSFFVFQSMFATAFFLMFLGFLVAYTYGKKFWVIKSGVLLVIGLFAFMALLEPLISILTTHTISDSSMYSGKVTEVFDVLSGNAAMANDMSTRSDLANSSWKTFLNNPILGANIWASDESELVGKELGNHSEWLDQLALYGIFALLLFAFLIKTIKTNLKRLDIFSFYFVYLVLGFLNPVYYFIQNLTCFFYIPLLLEALHEDNCVYNQKY